MVAELSGFAKLVRVSSRSSISDVDHSWSSGEGEIPRIFRATNRALIPVGPLEHIERIATWDSTTT